MSILRKLLINNALKKKPARNSLTFTAVLDNSAIKLIQIGYPNEISVQYKLNDNAWCNYNIGDIISLSSINDKVIFKNFTNTFSKDSANYYNFEMIGKILVNGNINSLINYNNSLTNYCYCNLFSNCSSLINTPLLPATTLAAACYQNMFNGCSCLTSTPLLPASTLMPSCYYNMFTNCYSLTAVPYLPAKKLTEYCYYGMFNNCVSLSSIQYLPATALNKFCYYGMFQNCSSLVNVPLQLPATKLNINCYQNMFNGCISLTDAPLIKATILAQQACLAMFSGCVSLTSVQTILSGNPVSNWCYSTMFKDCKNLITAPILPATALTNGCYYSMFQNCSKLNYINVNFSSWPTGTMENAVGTWLSKVSPTGTFICPSALPDIRGTSRIPVKWNVLYHLYDYVKPVNLLNFQLTLNARK